MPTGKDTVTSKTLPDGTIVVENARGSARLSRLGPGVVFFSCKGFLPAAFYPHMVALPQREMEQNERVVLFVDGWELHSVDTEFREAWTAWFKLHKQRFHMRLLVRSKLMLMAANLANLFTGVAVVKTYSSLAAWEQACSGDSAAFRTRRSA